MQRLTELIKKSRRIFAFTGAGVSTLSGIRDFRGKNGVYSQPWRGYRVEDILSLPLFHKRPELFYEWAKEFVYRLDDYQPSAVHRMLAKLEETGHLTGLYTQNIDLLHQKAGSKRVYELHGSPARHHCLKCGYEFDYARIAPTVMKGEVPRCGCGGLIKPDIVFYGENLDEELLDQAYRDMTGADLLLVSGSSLTVMPAAGLPEICASNGGKVVIINASATPLDHLAELKYTDLKEVAEFLLRQEW